MCAVRMSYSGAAGGARPPLRRHRQAGDEQLAGGGRRGFSSQKARRSAERLFEVLFVFVAAIFNFPYRDGTQWSRCRDDSLQKWAGS